MDDEANNPWREAAERGFEAAPPHDAEEQPPKRRSALGCVLWGCLITFIVGVVLLIAAAVGGYYFVRGQIERFTDPEPVELPVVAMTDAELAELEGRVEAFRAGETPADAVEDAEPAPSELVLTADEINALLASNEDLKGRVHVRIEDGLVTGQVCVPTDFLPGMGGRFLNAEGTFDVSLADGDLTVRLVDGSVKGVRLPQQLLEALANEDLAEEVEREPDAARVLRRIKSLRVEGDRIVLTARRPDEAGAAAEPDAAAELETKAQPSNP